MTVLLATFVACTTLVLLLVATTTLAWTLYAWTSADTLRRTTFPPPTRPTLTFSLIVPARHEEGVLEATLRRLAASTHPWFEIIAVVGHDDDATARIAHDVAATDARVHVVVDANWPKNKPLALNSALPYCRGEIVGVFDAEDVVAEQLLTHVDTLFQHTNADVVQGGVQLMNYWSSWFAVRNVLEYFFWFRSRLHYHAAQGFIPLGGNTVFFRADVLRSVGGWDPTCLAEDCDVGVRLSARGHRVAVAYDPMLATREECPDSLPAFVKQRTRWNQGFLQVLRKKEWTALPSRTQRLLARYLLAIPFFQAASMALAPMSVAIILFVKIPVALALASFLPLIPIIATVIVDVCGLRDFGVLYGARIRLRDYVRCVVGTPLYQLLLAYSAFRAVGRELLGKTSWEKTSHAGAHLETPTNVPAADRGRQTAASSAR